ncbi:tRNA (N(6)-L-threonylcarbamoyladenosine(37)-C(2))-methylthiotransferase [Candidatus Woesearchaeota archaeon]|nr:tRNA (N(6)-L-threonylcarbamoyladenosine(37)-C(2))-methylthiotransferase [Candidatus Woesearchaeota archaeon]
MTKVYFQTHGCSTNLSESEVMCGLLKNSGFEIVDDPGTADILAISICTVKGENNALRHIRKLNELFPEKKLIIAGCITRIILKEARKIKEDASFISTHNIKSIVDVVEEVLNDNVIEATGRDEYKKINLPKIRKNPVVGIIPILNGCSNYCSYCSVKYVKGKLFSYDMDDIETEALKCLSQGCRELWITSQDNSAYMLDKAEKSQLPELLRKIISIDQRFMVRVGMMNPYHLLQILEPMIGVFKDSKIFKFLHVPVQSGNDEILKLMKRNYKASEFKRIIAEFRKNIPDITISTDIICGFPTETEQQFNDSLSLVKELKPDVLNISRFMARHGTEAAKMEGQLDGEVIKNRSRLLTDIYLNISRMNNERWIGWEGNVLIDEEGKKDSLVGRNLAYKPIILRKGKGIRLGDLVRARIVGSTPYDLRAETA